MIEFIRPPPGPRIELLRIQAIQRANPTEKEASQTIIRMRSSPMQDSISTRPQYDQVEISEEGQRRLTAALAAEQQTTKLRTSPA